MRESLRAWILLLLLPLVPVALLYWFFGEQNYFELQDTARGIVALGPIAAYVALVGIGWRLFASVESTLDPRHSALPHLPGEWAIESISRHGTTYKGTARIRCSGARISLDGDFYKDGSRVGAWESRAAALVDGTLYVVYAMTELKGDDNVHLTGVCELQVGEKRFEKMSGMWIVLGREGMSGEIAYLRQDA